MKRTLCIGFILVLTSLTAFGQIGVSTGITGGLNFATLGGSDASIEATTTQFAAGVFAEISFPLLPITIQPEVLYSVKGTYVSIPAGLTWTDKFSYIDIPILIKYYLPIPVVKPFIFIGPSVGFLVSAKGTPNIGNELDIKDQVTSTDFGAVVGVGVKIPLVVADLSLDARYDYGLTSTDKINSANIYNRVVSVYLGIAF
jgi:hypothetical protein